METGLDKFMKFDVYFNKKPFRQDPLQSNLKGSVQLPIPANIQDNYSWKYQDTQLGRFLGPMAPSIKNAIMSLSKNPSFGGAVGAVESIFGSVDTNALGVAAISNIVGIAAEGAGSTGGSADSFFIGAANPYLVNNFAGVGFKTWSFQFFMVPRNRKDSEACRQIINFFRYFASPSFDSSGSILDTSYTFKLGFFGVPGSFPSVAPQSPTALSASSANPYLPVIQESVLTDMQVAYNSSGLSAFHSDGSPVDYLVSLQFKETKILTQENLISSAFAQESPSSSQNSVSTASQ